MPLSEEKQHWLAAHPELTVQPSMKRRCDDHDYRGRYIYHVTLCVAGRG